MKLWYCGAAFVFAAVVAWVWTTSGKALSPFTEKNTRVPPEKVVPVVKEETRATSMRNSGVEESSDLRSQAEEGEDKTLAKNDVEERTDPRFNRDFPQDAFIRLSETPAFLGDNIWYSGVVNGTQEYARLTDEYIKATPGGLETAWFTGMTGPTGDGEEFSSAYCEFFLRGSGISASKELRTELKQVLRGYNKEAWDIHQTLNAAYGVGVVDDVDSDAFFAERDSIFREMYYDMIFDIKTILPSEDYMKFKEFMLDCNLRLEDPGLEEPR